MALDPIAVAVDVAAFERAVATAVPEGLAEASALYQGDLLAGLAVTEAPFEDWLLTERERLRELALEALARLLAHQRAAGCPEAAVQTALQLTALEPLQESVHRTLMRLYVESGAGVPRSGSTRTASPCSGESLAWSPSPRRRSSIYTFCDRGRPRPSRR